MAQAPPLLGNTPIGIDARMLGREGSGVATYAAALRRATCALTARPVLLGASHGDDGPLRRSMGALRHIERRITVARASDGVGDALMGRDLFRRGHIHFRMFRRPLRIVADHPPGIMHWTYPLPIVLDGWANLYTVHDVIPLTHPHLTGIDPRRHRAVLDALAREAAGFVTVSDAAHHDIVETLQLPDGFVRNAGQEVDSTSPPDAPLPAGLQTGGYFLFCGAIDPRKNLDRLIEAHQRSGTDLPLVIVGPAVATSGRILRRISASKAIRLPAQERDTVRRLIQHARALLFPSLAEGFGLPVVEAMALGTAVLTSNHGALAEVAGGAALLVDPTDIDAMGRGIATLGADDTLIARLTIAGRQRAAHFSPDRFADRLAAIYRDVLADQRDI